MPKLYELSDADGDLFVDLFIFHRRTWRPRADDRLMIKGVL